MQIRYFATIRTITGENALYWDKPEATLGELLHDLHPRYGRNFQNWVLDGDALGPAIIILVNGYDVRHLNGIDTKLQADDIISIFPVVAGG
ncbi:MAG: ubiquitin-like small modifier protein 1 [Chloroflexota bacterium]